MVQVTGKLLTRVSKSLPVFFALRGWGLLSTPFFELANDIEDFLQAKAKLPTLIRDVQSIQRWPNSQILFN
jgi:hypothetical protein